MRRYSYLLFTLLFALTFTACDSGDGDGDGNGNGNGNGNGATIGSSSVTVSGGITDSFSGSAAFGVSEDGDGFSLALFEGGLPTSGTFSGAVVAIGRSGDRPEEGTYQFGVSGDAFAGVYASMVSTTNPTGGMFVSSISGTLEITSSSSDEVAGSFSFTGQGLSGTGGQLGEVTVQGSFSADFASNIPSTSFP